MMNFLKTTRYALILGSSILASHAHAEMMRVSDIPAGDTLNVRTGPGTSFEDIGDLQQDRMVNVTQITEDGKWAQINYMGTPAYVATKHLEPMQRGGGPVAANGLGPHVVSGIKADDADGGLVVRNGDGKDFASIGVLTNNTAVHVIQRNRDGKWAMVNFGTGVGWVSSHYLTAQSATNTQPSQTQPKPMPSVDPNTAPDGLPLPAIFKVVGVPQGDVLWVGNEASTSAAPVTNLMPGAPVAVLGMATAQWVKVSVGQNIGFVEVEFLKRGGGTTNEFGFQLDLKCAGTEPFWNMQFNTDRSVVYTIGGQASAPATLQSTTFSSTPTGYPYTFTAAPYAGQVNLEICSDGMSDIQYPMSISTTAPNEMGTMIPIQGCCRLQ